MGRSSEGSGQSRTCTLDATNDASPAPGRARYARGKIPCWGLRQACGKVPTPLHAVNHFVSRTQHYWAGSPCITCRGRAVHSEMCKNCTVFNTAVSAAQCLHEVPQLHRRKFAEAVLDLALGPLQEDPARGPVALAAREVQPPAHRPGPHLRIGLNLHENVPPLVATLQLTHVLGAVVPWEGSAHGPLGDATTLRCTKARLAPRMTSVLASCEAS